MEWKHERDWDGNEWWSSTSGELEALVCLPDGFDGSEWDAYQWRVYDSAIGGTVEGPYGEPTLEQAMEACVSVIAEIERIES